MLTPSEIDLLRRDLEVALKVVGPDEIEDARTLICEHDFLSEDFEIFQRSDPSPPYPNPVVGTVTVVRKSSGAAATYDAGSGSLWLMQLETDLKSGAFGRPR